MAYGDKEALHIGAHEGDVAPVEEDEATSGFKLFLDMGLEIGSKMDEQTKQLKFINRQLQDNTPVFFSTSVNGIAANGGVFLNLGSPDRGKQWEVGFLAIGGNDVNIAAAGIAGAYVVGGLITAANGVGVTGGLSNLQEYFATLPNVDFYSQKQFLVNDGEYLVIQIFNATNGQNYVASAQITVYDLSQNAGKTVITE